MNKIKKIKILIILFLTFFSCTPFFDPLCTKNGKTYGRNYFIFTGTWYEHYYRALSYIDGECYFLALDDLKTALTKSRKQDKFWTHTYGMHYLNFFPHREIGIIYYLLKDFNKAEKELKISIEQESSDRAIHYLGLVMKQQKQPFSKPELFLDAEYLLINKSKVTISGTIKDSQYIHALYINNKSVLIERLKQELSFSEQYILPHGKHRISVKAQNLMGVEVEKIIIVDVDRVNPVISIEKYIPGIELCGYVKDQSNDLSFFLNNKKVKLNILDNVGYFSLQLKPEMSEVILKAIDKADNETIADLKKHSSSVTYNRSNQLHASKDSGDVVVADTDTAAFHKKFSRQKPEILLDGWPEQETVFEECVNIGGEVTSSYKIYKLMITVTNTSLYPHKSYKIELLNNAEKSNFFNPQIDLFTGENEIKITAIDETGKKEEKKIIIFRGISEINKDKYLPSVIVSSFTNNFKNHISDIFDCYFKEQFIKKKRFQLEKEKHWYSFIVEFFSGKSNEINIPFDHSKFMIRGYIYETNKSLEISARLIDMNTRNVIDVKDVYSENKSDDALKLKAHQLCMKFHKDFPLIDEELMEPTSDGTFTVKTEKANNVHFYNRPLLYRLVDKRYNPVTHQFLGANTEIIGLGKIVEIQNNQFSGKINKKILQKLEARVRIH